MKLVSSTTPVSLAVGFDVKSRMVAVARDLGLEQLVAHLENGVTKYPFVVSVSSGALVATFHVITVGEERFNVALEISMPCGESSLVWMPWLPHQQQPQRSPGDYQHVNFGQWALMPRRTKCYDYAYGFSGQVHPVEPVTPPSIVALYAETNAIFGLPEPGTNMCLENDYDNGREAISEHADDENQFGSLHDVFCWVTGPASRCGVFRVKTTRKGVAPELHRLCADPSDPDGSRELFSINIPAGLYVMRGRKFQERYTHEFPEMHKSLFDSLRNHADLIPGFPLAVEKSEKGASRAPVVQANWVKEHIDEVKAVIRSKKLKRRRPVGEDVAAIDEWCLERTSYTLRSFDPTKRAKGAIVEKK